MYVGISASEQKTQRSNTLDLLPSLYLKTRLYYWGLLWVRLWPVDCYRLNTNPEPGVVFDEGAPELEKKHWQFKVGVL